MGHVIWPLLWLAIAEFVSQVVAEFCPEYGHTCLNQQKCCGRACCISPDLQHHYHATFRWSIWNMWYFWFVVIFVLMTCFGGCRYYRRRQLMLAQQQAMMAEAEYPYIGAPHLPPPRPQRFRRILPTFPLPILARWNIPYGDGLSQPQREGGAIEGNFPQPPPYTEVVAKPYEYPCTKDDLPPYPGLRDDIPVPTLDTSEGVHHLGPSSSGSVAPPVPPYSATPAEGESIIIAALGAMSPPASTSSGPPPSSNNRVNASVSRGLDNPDSTSTLAATGLTPVEETRCTPV